MNPHPKCMTLEGGGALGAGYGGAISAWHAHGLLEGFTHFIGTSAGSIMAGVLACKPKGRENLNEFIKYCNTALKNVDFNIFLDDSWGVIRDIHRLRTKYGWYKGDAFEKWYSGVIKDLTGNDKITFQEVYDRYGHELYMCIGNLDDEEPMYIGRHNYPDLPIVRGSRYSMSIPGVFAAKKLDDCVIVDGGVYDNYPIHYFDDEKFCDADNITKFYEDHMARNRAANTYETLEDAIRNGGNLIPDTSDIQFVNPLSVGMKLETATDLAKKKKKVTDIKTFALKLALSVYNQAQKVHLKKADKFRTIIIDCGELGSMDFDMTEEQKDWLIKQGHDATDLFIRQNYVPAYPRAASREF